MTVEQFNQTGFAPNMTAEYRGGEYKIVGVDFIENLVALAANDEPNSGNESDCT